MFPKQFLHLSWIGLLHATCTCLLAGVPTSRSPSAVNATTEGVVLDPSAFSSTFGVFPSITATQEFVVPRSMPQTAPRTASELQTGEWTSQKICNGMSEIQTLHKHARLCQNTKHTKKQGEKSIRFSCLQLKNDIPQLSCKQHWLPWISTQNLLCGIKLLCNQSEKMNH